MCNAFSGTARVSFTFGYLWLYWYLSIFILGYLTAVNGMEHNIRCGELHILLYTGNTHGMCKCDDDCTFYTLLISHWYGQDQSDLHRVTCFSFTFIRCGLQQLFHGTNSWGMSRSYDNLFLQTSSCDKAISGTVNGGDTYRFFITFYAFPVWIG